MVNGIGHHSRLMVKTVTAVEHVRPLCGGSCPHLMRADDGRFYVVKFLNNPQHPRVLINEFLATCLAERLGLPVPEVALVHVPAGLVEASPKLRIALRGGLGLLCSSGLQFGARFCGKPQRDVLFDVLPASLEHWLQNREVIAGAYVFDRWVGNIDARQFVFVRKARRKEVQAVLIDQGMCFGGGDWTFYDAPLQGLMVNRSLYRSVTSWEALEPWVERIEGLPSSHIQELATGVPKSWYPSRPALDRMAKTLVTRRARLHSIVLEAVTARGNPFVNWCGIEQRPTDGSPGWISAVRHAA